MNEIYKTKHPRMRAYKNEVLDMLGNFFSEHRVMVIPRIENRIVDSLATIARKFKIPIYSNKKYKTEVVNRPSIPNNSNYWKFFEDDLQINRFLEMSDDFSKTVLDRENHSLDISQEDEEFAETDEGQKKLKK